MRFPPGASKAPASANSATLAQFYSPLSDPGVGSLSFPGSEGKEAIETSHLKLGAFVEV